MKVEFDTPPKVLSPNAKAPRGGSVAFYSKMKVKKKYKADCFFLAIQAIQKGWTMPSSDIVGILIECHPKDGNQPDDDNVTASFKYGRDAIALAFKMDDKKFRYLPVMFRDPVPGGKYVVSLYPLTSDGRIAE